MHKTPDFTKHSHSYCKHLKPFGKRMVHKNVRKNVKYQVNNGTGYYGNYST